MDNVKILVTGGGAPGAYGIISALKKNPAFTIVSCDANPDTIGASLCNESFIVPLGTHPDYIDVLLARCIEFKIDVVLPITTKELGPLSQSKGLFAEQNISIVVSDPIHLKLANNKGKLYQFLEKNGVEIPQFIVINSVNELRTAAEKLGHPKKPIVVKPVIGNGSRGVRILDESTNRLDLLFNAKPSTMISDLNQLTETLELGSFPKLLVSEYMSGAEYTVDCLLQNGKPKLIVPRVRSKINNGISVEGAIVKNEEIINYSRAVLAHLNLDGPIGIQVKMNDNNRPLLVEINPRLQGTTVACLGAGVNLAELAVLALLGEQIDWEKENEAISWNTKFIRHYSEIYF